jgi:hypothetical protein
VTAFDHVVLAAGPEGLTATAERVAALLGAPARPGGVHTTFGTRNAIVPLGAGYLEVVAVEDEAVAAAHPFGSAVARRVAAGGGWVGWAVAVDDTAPVCARLGTVPVPGGRVRPDGVRLAWEQAGVEVLAQRAWLPFFLRWDVPADLHPAAGGPAGVVVTSVGFAVPPGTDGRADLRTWLDAEPPVPVTWTTTGAPGPQSVTFATPSGEVVVRA